MYSSRRLQALLQVHFADRSYTAVVKECGF
jgi:hypothetical protein